MTKSREVQLVRRPVGVPRDDDFAVVDRELAGPGPGEVLVVNHALSLDPYMRGRMDDRESYSEPYRLGEALDGAAVGEVIAGGGPGVGVGDLVRTGLGWRTHAVLPAAEVDVLERIPGVADSAHIGVLGMPGFTAWVGLFAIAQMGAGDAVFVSSAAGSVGSLAVQLARLHGARVIGSAGSAEKVAWLVDGLGVDAAFDYHQGPVLDQLRAAAPEGIDVYFDNVGGDHLQAALEVMNVHGRIAVSGMVSTYNDTTRTPGPDNLLYLVTKRLRAQGFLNAEHLDQTRTFLDTVAPALRDGRVRHTETVVEGIEQAPQAFRDMLDGRNVGKTVIAP